MVAAATDVLSLQSAKEYLNITVDKHDDELGEFLAAAVAEVELFRDEVLVDRDVEQTAVSSNGTLLLSRLPVRVVTSVTSLDQPGRSWSPAGLRVSDSGVLFALTGPPLHGLLQVNYRAGMATVPPNYPAAVKLVLAQAWRTQRPGQPGARGGQMGNSGGNNSGPTPMRRIVEDVLGATLPGIA